jgi:uncharacterized protein YqgC (DUF456 family)
VKAGYVLFFVGVPRIMLEIAVIIVGSILIFLGLAGSLLPILPGPPLSFIGLLLLALVRTFSSPLTPTLIIVMGLLTVAAVAADHIIPVWGARRYGASKWGLWGSVTGMVIGIFFSPWGMLLGGLVGAVVAEWLAYRETGQALRAGWGVIVGILLGTVLKLVLSAVMAYYFVRALF